jgi:hypothetical protein
VVTYDIARQGTLADRMEQGAHRIGINWFDSILAVRSAWELYGAAWFRRFGLWALGVVALGILIGLGGGPVFRLLRMRLRVQRVRRGQASVADATLLYQRMLHILKRRGYQKPAWFTPAEFAASLPRTELGLVVGEFTAAYNALRFGGHTGAAPRLTVLLDRLEQQ